MTGRRQRAIWPVLAAAIIACLALAEDASGYALRALVSGPPSRIASFSTHAPGTVDVEPVQFPAGATDTQLLGIAYRRSTGDLYGIAAEGTVYVLTGAGPFVAVPLGPKPAVDPISSSQVGFAIDPVGDLLSVLGPAENLTFEPFNGTLLTASPPLSYSATTGGKPDPNAGKAPRLVAAGFQETTPRLTEKLYAIDAATGYLVSVSRDPAAPGVVYSEGPLSLGAITEVAGLDVPLAAEGAGLALHVETGIAVLQKQGDAGSQLCQVTLREVFSGKVGVLARPGETHCEAIAPGLLLDSVAIEPYSVVRFEGSGDEAPSFQVPEGSVRKVYMARAGSLAKRIEVPWSTSAARTGRGIPHLHGVAFFEAGQSRASFSVRIPNDHLVTGARELGLSIHPGTSDDWVAGQPSVVRIRVLDDDLRAQIRRPRKPLSLRRVLRRRRLALRYACSERCRIQLALFLRGRELFPVAEGRSNSAGRGVAVFRIDGRTRTALRRAAGRRGVWLTAAGSFRTVSARAAGRIRIFLSRRR